MLRSYSQRSQNKNGLNKRERSRNQVMLKGRGKRIRTGVYPGRGKGRTAHGRR
jgi:hypothetical protein